MTHQDNLPGLRLFALSSLFDLLLSCLAVASLIFLTYMPVVSEAFGSLLCNLWDERDGLDDCERTWRAQLSTYLVLALVACLAYLQATLAVFRFYSASTKAFYLGGGGPGALSLPTVLEEADGPQEFPLADAPVKQL
jgi:hypothetical protein